MWNKFKLLSKLTYFSSENLTASEMYREMLAKLNKFAKILGCNAFSANYTALNPAFFRMLVLIGTATAENLAFIYSNRNNITKFVFGLTFFPSMIQTYTRLYAFIVKREILVDVFDRIDIFYLLNDKEWSKKILEKNVLNSCHIGLFLSTMLLGGAVLITVYPIVVYLVLDEVVLHFGFQLFLIDWKTPFGYALNFVNDMICLFLFCLGTMLVCLDITMCVLCAYSQYDILNVYLNQLDELLDGNVKANEKEIKKKIAMIADMHNYVIDFIDTFNELFVSYYFMEIGTLVIQTSMTLFALTSMNFYPGYVIIVFTMYQMLVPCVFGTFLSSKGDEYYDNLCNIKWYMLSISDQRSIALLLTGALKERTLTTGLVTLNFETFVEICKAVYSYYTILTSF